MISLLLSMGNGEYEYLVETYTVRPGFWKSMIYAIHMREACTLMVEDQLLMLLGVGTHGGRV